MHRLARFLRELRPRACLVLAFLISAAGGRSVLAGTAGYEPAVCTFIPPLEYPAGIEDRSLGGVVVVMVHLDKAGSVAGVEVLPSKLPPAFILEARKSAEESRFIPARQDGKAVESDIALPFRFDAPEPPPSAGPEGVDPENPESLSASAPPSELSSFAPPAREPGPGFEGETPPAQDLELLPDGAPPPPSILEGASGLNPRERETSSAVASSLTLAEAGFGRGASAAGLMDPGDVFEEGDKVYFRTRITGGGAGQQVLHVWSQGGQTAQIIELSLKGPDWPTWSYKTLFAGASGPWSVGVWDENGTLLGERRFTCRADR